jgi:transcriptional regulator with XRE-family HTH domain
MLVRKLRLQRGWSQEHLAELVGVTPRTIQRIERGYRPGLETAKALASVFEVDVSIFTTAEELPMQTNEQAREMPSLTEEEERAMEYVKGIKEFYFHLGFYVVFVVLYGLVWSGTLMFSPPPNKAFAVNFLLWGAFGWGVGLLFHGLVAFEKIGRRWPGADWERKAIEKRLGRKL